MSSLSTQIRKSYTYLILFYDGSFYYGVRLCPKGKTPWQDIEYVGSPSTHKDKWNKVKFIKFILEVFDDYKLAQEKEKQLIRPNLNNPGCLNENIGGIMSISSHVEGGRIAGRIAVRSGQLESIRSKENSRKGGKRNKGSKKTQKLGKLWGKKNIKIINSQKWKCLITGFISTPGALSRYQKARGIDTSLRERIE